MKYYTCSTSINRAGTSARSRAFSPDWPSFDLDSGVEQPETPNPKDQIICVKGVQQSKRAFMSSFFFQKYLLLLLLTWTGVALEHLIQTMMKP